VHRATVLFTQDSDAAAKEIIATHAAFVSSGVVENHTQELQFTRGFLARDPDGHAIEIVGVDPIQKQELVF